MKITGFLIAALLVLAPIAHADSSHECQGNSCNGGGENNANANSEAYSGSTAAAGANSNSAAVSVSGGNSLTAGGGESFSSSTAGGGSATAIGGSSGAVIHDVTGGNATATGGSSGDSTSSSGGNSQDVSVGGNSVTFDRAAASAGAVFAGHCQSGASGQMEAGGFTVVNSEQFCDYIRLAAVMLEAYEREMRDCRCEGICSRSIASTDLICTESEKAEMFLDAYYENLHSAHELLQASEVTAIYDRVFGQSIRPLALLGALIWLL